MQWLLLDCGYGGLGSIPEVRDQQLRPIHRPIGRSFNARRAETKTIRP